MQPEGKALQAALDGLRRLLRLLHLVLRLLRLVHWPDGTRPAPVTPALHAGSASCSLLQVKLYPTHISRFEATVEDFQRSVASVARMGRKSLLLHRFGRHLSANGRKCVWELTFVDEWRRGKHSKKVQQVVLCRGEKALFNWTAAPQTPTTMQSMSRFSTVCLSAPRQHSSRRARPPRASTACVCVCACTSSNERGHKYACMRACVCMHACVRACLRACGRARTWSKP